MRFGYARRSTREQETSLAVQRAALEAEGCDEVFEDTISGAKSKRPEMTRMLDKVREGDHVMVVNLDRFGRTTLDALTTIVELGKRGVIVECLQPRVDTSTPDGMLVMTCMMALAQHERDHLIRRTRASLDFARSQGRVGGRPPKIPPDLVVSVMAQVESGQSYAQIAKLHGVHPATIGRVVAAERKRKAENDDE